MTATPQTPQRPKKPSWWAENWKALAAVWAIALLPFLPILLSGQIYASSDQAGAPGWKFYFDAMRDGVIPLWNPYALAGMPTFDLMFGDGSYLPFILLGFVLPVTHVVTFNYTLHLLLAGLTSYLLARIQFKLERWIAAALAVAWVLNPHIISYIYAGHTGKYHILAWLPLALLFLLRALSPTARWQDLMGLALTVAAFVFTTHLQFTYFIMMGFILVWLFHLVPAIAGRRFGEAASLVVRFWAPFLIGVGLAFFIFNPPMQYTKDYGIRGSAEKTTWEHATSWSMHPEEVASLLVPEFGGINENYWGRNVFKMNTESPGVLVWFLGLFGLLAFRRVRWYWLWSGIGFAAIIYGLAAHTPVFRLFYEFVPGVKNFRAASMMLFWLSVALLVMSADALRRLLIVGPGAISDAQRAVWARRLRITGFSVVGVLGVFTFMPSIAYSLWGAFVDESLIPGIARQSAAESAFAVGAFRVAALVALLTWGLTAFMLKARRPLAFGLLALTVAVVDGYWVNLNVSTRLTTPAGYPAAGFIQGQEPGRGFATEPAVEYLKSVADTSRFRIFGLPGAFEWRYGQYHGLEIVDGWTDNEMRIFREYRGNDYQRNPNLFAGLRQNPDGSLSGSVFFDMLNVEYLAFRTEQAPGIQLARNASVLPRAWFVPQWEAVTDSQALNLIKMPGFNPRSMAYVSGESATSGGAAPDSGMELVRATETEWGYNRHVYTVNAPTAGVLVVSELWFPHWKAKVDGRDVPVLRANFAFRGIVLEPGSHEIEFVYRSPWLRTGFLVSLLSAISLVVLCVVYARIHKKRAAGSAIA
jgi:hypothetical protein